MYDSLFLFYYYFISFLLQPVFEITSRISLFYTLFLYFSIFFFFFYHSRFSLRIPDFQFFTIDAFSSLLLVELSSV